MALVPYADADSMTLIICVQNDGSVPQMTEDLNQALTLVEESLKDDDLYYATIDLSGTWRPGDAELNPWEVPFLSSWQSLIANPAMHEPLARWLARVVSLIKEANETQVSCLSESDETQFGEIPASLLAGADRRYLPLYTDLLAVWDLDHAVNQFEIVDRLVELYGEGSDTDPLIAAVADWV